MVRSLPRLRSSSEQSRLALSHADLLKTVESLQNHVDEAKATLHLASAAVPLNRPPISSARAYNGPVDTTVLIVNTHGGALVSPSALSDVVGHLFLDGNVAIHEWHCGLHGCGCWQDVLEVCSAICW